MDMVSIFKDMLGSLITGTKGKLVACMLAIVLLCLFIGGVIYERSKDYDINEHTSKAVIAALEEADCNKPTGKVAVVSTYDGGYDEYLKSFLSTIRFN